MEKNHHSTIRSFSLATEMSLIVDHVTSVKIGIFHFQLCGPLNFYMTGKKYVVIVEN